MIAWLACKTISNWLNSTARCDGPVNYFQPSLKLVAKQRDGKKVHHIYDVAKTLLQRVLLSEGVPPKKQQELNEMARALDPLWLFQQLERLQQAIFRCVLDASQSSECVPSEAILLFALADGLGWQPVH